MAKFCKCGHSKLNHSKRFFEDDRVCNNCPCTKFDDRNKSYLPFLYVVFFTIMIISVIVFLWINFVDFIDYGTVDGDGNITFSVHDAVIFYFIMFISLALFLFYHVIDSFRDYFAGKRRKTYDYDFS